MNALSIQSLTKTYDNGVNALKGISLEVEQGDFFALLGPNGAGKSTAIGIISSLVNPTAGRVMVCGHDLLQSPFEAKRKIGLVPQEFNFSVFESVRNIVLNVAGYNGIPRREAANRCETYLKKLDLWDKRDVQAKTLSGGMKRRLMIARALVHEPSLLILDEPTAGVDIEIRRSMWDFIEEMNRENGITIILTTHYLEEAEALCRRVAIIDEGEIIEQGEVNDLLSRSMQETFVLDIEGTVPTDLAVAQFGHTVLADGKLEIVVPRGQSLNTLFAILSDAGVVVSSMRNKSNRLEEFFMRLVGHREESATT